MWRHEGPPMLPPSYNDMMQILQTEDYVVVMQEMRENDARIIPSTAGRTCRPACGNGRATRGGAGKAIRWS